MTNLILSFYKSMTFKRIVLYSSIVLLAFELRSFANLFLMLFFVTYIMNELCKFIHKQVSKVVNVSEELIILLTYFLLISTFIIVGVRYIPGLITQAKLLSKSFDVSKGLNTSINTNFNNFLDSIDPSFKNIIELSNFDFANKINELSTNIMSFSYTFLKGIGKWVFNIFLMIILSLFFLIEKNKMKQFAEVFKTSKVSFVYYELKPLFLRFYISFGAIIKSQLIVSFINTNLTVIALAILGFSNLFALGMMVFLFGLIPVAGAILSSIPLILIGFKLGGMTYVFYIIAIVAAIHVLEAYILNPRILSSFTHLPVFITLVVLLLSEHILGPWGLIYGLPLFIFIIDSFKNTESVNNFSKNGKLDKKVEIQKST